MEGIGPPALRRAVIAAWLLAAAPGCDREAGQPQAGTPAQTGSATPAPAPADAGAAAAADAGAAAAARAHGDAARGQELVRQFECNRCHVLPGDDGIAARDKSCAGCHRSILDWKPPVHGPIRHEALTKMRDNLRTMRYVPPLATGYYRRAWLERFLVEPYDLRPNLPAMMPRLAMTKEQARDIAAYLGRDAAPEDPGGVDGGAASVLERANLDRGRQLMKDKGCMTCHVMTGVPGAEHASTARDPKTLKDAASAVNLWSGSDPVEVIALAPDLRHARERFDVPTLIAWITDPDSIKRVRPQMPKPPVSAEEARDIAAYLVKAELSPPAPPAIPARLPPLGRSVRYEEIAEKVFNKTCRHCHAEPDEALGDGGPGNTGGFGFAPRGLNLAEFEGVAAGSLDNQGERRSVFSKTSDGTPLLVRALLARQAEEAGRPDPEVRGMPLGLPALTPEEIQVVEAWIAQGHPR